MAADANRCPSCGAERPANTAAGDCPRCLIHQATAGDTPVMAAVDAPTDPEPTVAYSAGPVAGSASSPTDATGDCTTAPDDLTRTADSHGATSDRPRGATVRYFGDYEIQNELGRGGMGVVYKARQVSLNRPVALKMIKAGVLADDDELRRFQNEAEAVALLDHPGIVPVYEVGDHDVQRYFSMKLVEGGNLAERLSTSGDNPRTAARLLAETAEAVHHAHMRGILHRDLKPANILIDADGHAHVTDFGLAKRIGGDVELTATGAIMGTPAYMSPEQASGRRDSVTTASDVYGLGAIFYALLTGRAPFGGDSIIETLDAVRTRTPEPPTKVNAHVPRDLETICLKCLEKDPRRRYASAQALADDLHAWLDSRPITARRVGGAELAWLWCKRRPAVAALAASVFMAIVGGTTAVIAVQARANSALQGKNGELTVANNRITKANADLSSAKERVKQRFDLANDAIKLFHGQVGDDLVLKADPLKPLRDKLLKGAADFYVKLEGVLKDQPDRVSRVMMGNTYFELGELTEKIGDKAEALASHLKGLAVRRVLASEPIADVDARFNVAKSLRAAANLLKDTGKQTESLEYLGEARHQLEALPASGPGSEERRGLLGRVYLGIGLVLVNVGKADEALGPLRRAESLLEGLVKDDLRSAGYRIDLANNQTTIADALRALGRSAEARERYDRAIAMLAEMIKANPDVTTYRSSLAGSVRRRGLTRLAAGDAAGAVADTRKAIALYDVLPSRSVDELYELACCHAALAAAAGRAGSRISAGEGPTAAEKAMALIRKAVSDGYRNADAMAREPALDPLRNRPEFRLLMLDVAFPAEPFAR